MKIQKLTGIPVAELLPLYAAVGWTNYTDHPSMLQKAFDNSLLILGAYDGEKLVGLIRTVGDGCSIVFIQDIIVLPEYQRKGIGTRLLREITNRFESAYQIELFTDDTEETTAFYRSAGFKKAEDIGCCSFIRM